MSDELAQSLRTWREHLDPGSAGLERGASRHTPGLRREEVALRAGVSVNYLTRLEQGRARTPSVAVIAALARALQLDASQTTSLHRMAGFADPSVPHAGREISPSVTRFLARFEDVPAIVVDVTWSILAANEMARAFFAEEVIGENAVRRQFAGPAWAERDSDDERQYERDLTGDLRQQVLQHPEDEQLLALVAELRASSPRFEQLWAEHPSGFPSTTRKTFNHPVVGRLTVDCDVFSTFDGDVRIVVWSAPSGTPDAAALRKLAEAAGLA